MDVSQALRDVENSVRNLISYQLNKTLGSDWVSKCGVTTDRIQQWEQRKAEEVKRLKSVDERILYYADFYDLLTILKKHWSSCFSSIFGEFKKFEVLWKLLESFRNPDAHRRELLPYQTNLVLGISGKLRTEITSYFSKMETGESYFPRLESVQDNLGNMWHYNTGNVLLTKDVLRPGDMLQLSASAFDPLGEQLLFRFRVGLFGLGNWTSESNATITIDTTHIGESVAIWIEVRSDRAYHARGESDHAVHFYYSILPPIQDFHRIKASV